ncbi:hypothetical protein PR202_gb00871 [Eleusine coracana subsp. coracana]|uniref:Uncharacterized protein n=1 Tax=Eleusine coracana subsp. coracana TaxID=191504 RepID=A0AAV5DV15_ELECO|nr:hypothetical protein PR202_gb00871 [Eleusine coracana subsp. coracana]
MRSATAWNEGAEANTILLLMASSWCGAAARTGARGGGGSKIEGSGQWRAGGVLGVVQHAMTVGRKREVLGWRAQRGVLGAAGAARGRGWVGWG